MIFVRMMQGPKDITVLMAILTFMYNQQPSIFEQGEYGAESRICRWIACFIFMLSALACLVMLPMLPMLPMLTILPAPCFSAHGV